MHMLKFCNSGDDVSFLSTFSCSFLHPYCTKASALAPARPVIFVPTRGLSSASGFLVSSPSRALSSAMLLFLVLAVVVCQAQDEAVFFPSQPPSFVQLRSLRDILFQKESPETASKELPVVLSSFEPNDPSPTLASPPLAPGVSKIRFLETDTFFVPPPFQESEELAEPSSEHEEQLSTDILPPALIRQAKSAADAGAPGATDRWSWPSGSRALPVEQSQGRALSAPSIVSVVSSHPPPTLSLKKSVAKPYRLLSKGSSCPKLLHDLTIHCTLPPQHLHEPLVRLRLSSNYRERIRSYVTVSCELSYSFSYSGFNDSHYFLLKDVLYEPEPTSTITCE